MVRGAGKEYEMKGALTGLALSAMALLAVGSGCEKSGSGAGAKRGGAEYLAALTVANHFCQAWQDRDFSGARALLTDSLVASMRERELRDALVGPGTVDHIAYELSGGSGSDAARWTFPVKFYTRFLGTTADRIETVSGKLEIVRDEAGAWRIGSFPTPPRGVSLDRN
jgi:hypothetical protein